MSPFGENWTAPRLVLPPSRVAVSVPLARSHIRTVLSAEADAIRRPSGVAARKAPSADQAMSCPRGMPSKLRTHSRPGAPSGGPVGLSIAGRVFSGRISANRSRKRLMPPQQRLRAFVSATLWLDQLPYRTMRSRRLFNRFCDQRTYCAQRGASQQKRCRIIVDISMEAAVRLWRPVLNRVLEGVTAGR
jgi:hypothetical protein